MNTIIMRYKAGIVTRNSRFVMLCPAKGGALSHPNTFKMCNPALKGA